jgi:phosphatidylserine synthase
LVAFGAAPAVLVYCYTLHQFGTFGILTTIAFVLCGAVRLARFNVSKTEYPAFASAATAFWRSGRAAGYSHD